MLLPPEQLSEHVPSSHTYLDIKLLKQKKNKFQATRIKTENKWKANFDVLISKPVSDNVAQLIQTDQTFLFSQ